MPNLNHLEIMDRQGRAQCSEALAMYFGRLKPEKSQQPA